MVDLAHLTLARASRAIAAGQLSSVELVEATLARIDACDPRLNSHVTVMAAESHESSHRFSFKVATESHESSHPVLS